MGRPQWGVLFMGVRRIRALLFGVYVPHALSTLTGSACKREQEPHQQQLTLSAKAARSGSTPHHCISQTQVKQFQNSVLFPECRSLPRHLRQKIRNLVPKQADMHHMSRHKMQQTLLWVHVSASGFWETPMYLWECSKLWYMASLGVYLVLKACVWLLDTRSAHARNKASTTL